MKVKKLVLLIGISLPISGICFSILANDVMMTNIPDDYTQDLSAAYDTYNYFGDDLPEMDELVWAEEDMYDLSFENQEELYVDDEEIVLEIASEDEEDLFSSDDNRESVTCKGVCGDNLTWEAVDDILYIRGTGDMKSGEIRTGTISEPEDDLFSAEETWIANEEEFGVLWPWSEMSDTITKIVIEDGVTSIGEQAFAGFHLLTEVVLSPSVAAIAEDAFKDCERLDELFLNQIKALQLDTDNVEENPELYVDQEEDSDLDEETEESEIEFEEESEQEMDFHVLNENTVIIQDINYVYNGKSQVPGIELRVLDADQNQVELQEGTDYEVTYYNQNTESDDTTNVGLITVEVSGIGNYSGIVSSQYSIVPCIISIW